MKKQIYGTNADLICVTLFWKEMKRKAELNITAAEGLGAQDPDLVEWHQERVKAIFSRVAAAKAQCAARLETGEWCSHP
ncbi:hypothetical protein CYD30_28760 [Kosakonia cowanii]|nr:hypothetical protein CYD30_28760 [Kosakonia cowanii]